MPITVLLSKAELGDTSNSRVSIGPEDYQAKGILYLPEGAFSELSAYLKEKTLVQRLMMQ